MARQLTPRSSLENLKLEAKRWLKALRSGDVAAQARLRDASSDAPQSPGLRYVQLALARELGFTGWSALKKALSESAGDQVGATDRVAWFLANACPDHHIRGGPAHAVALHTAENILKRYPEIARASLYSDIVCGELDEVERLLGADPSIASEKGGPKGSAGPQGSTLILDSWQADHPRWEPLLYLCFTRLRLPAVTENAVAIATKLLDHGANPNAHFMAGDSFYTPLVGAIGEGEEGRPPHPRRDELVKLLLDRGAEPYDIQVIYNIHFQGNVLWFLKLMHEHSLKLGRKADWEDPNWSMLNMGNYGSGARWHLDIAIRHNDLKLAEWALAHGASANAAPAKDVRLTQATPHEEATRRGLEAMAALLDRHGARPSKPVARAGIDRFVQACMRLDRNEAFTLATSNPEFLLNANAVKPAIQENRVGVLKLLLEMGMSPDIEDPSEGNRRPLHVAAVNDAAEVAGVLLEHGAEVDFRESSFNATPLGFAVYEQKPRVTDVLSRASKDVRNLTFAGKIARLREVLGAEPGLARTSYPDGDTPLMRLPVDDEIALEIVQVMLRCGVDPTIRNARGLTAAELASRRGMQTVASVLRNAERAWRERSETAQRERP